MTQTLKQRIVSELAEWRAEAGDIAEEVYTEEEEESYYGREEDIGELMEQVENHAVVLDGEALGKLHALFEEVDHEITHVERQGYPTSDVTNALDEVWEQVIPIKIRGRLSKDGLLQHKGECPHTYCDGESETEEA